MNGRHNSSREIYKSYKRNDKKITLVLKSILKETSGPCPTFKQKQMTFKSKMNEKS